jgi:hypothetical protein
VATGSTNFGVLCELPPNTPQDESTKTRAASDK